jgi:hypothetical protein
MSVFRTIRRSANTAVKLPFAMAWDVISLGNMGECASTSKVLREHDGRKQVDDLIEVAERAAELRRLRNE